MSLSAFNVKVLVKAIVFRTDKEFLAIQRSHDAPSRPLKWDLVGGNIDREDIRAFWEGQGTGVGGEQDILIKTLRREIKEEVGLEPNKNSFQILHAASGYLPTTQYYIIALVFVCKVSENVSVILENEPINYQWVTKEEFLQLDTGDDGRLLKSAIAKLHK